MLFQEGKVLIIAEVAQAHDGSLGSAHSFIEAAAYCGVDAVKFQTHIASAESSPEEPWRVQFSYKDKSRFEYWKRMEFSKEEWIGLREHAHRLGLRFASSPFSTAAVNLLSEVGVDFWKVASGEMLDPTLLAEVARHSEPVILSTGLATLDEITRAYNQLKESGREVAILQCTTQYPTPPEKVGLNLIGELKERFGCPVGLSDHSGEIWPSLAAVTSGASIVEAHITHSKLSFGPDVKASLDIEAFRHLVQGIRYTEKMLSSPLQLRVDSHDVEEFRKMFGKSVVVKQNLKKGSVLSVESLTCRKPATGIPPSEIMSLVGRRINRDLDAGKALNWEDLEA